MKTAIDAQAAQLSDTRLSIAGEVRERLWAVAASRETLLEATDHEHHLQAIADEVTLRVRAGDLVSTDGMLAQQEVLAWRTIKYEDIYLNGYANMGDLMLGITSYMAFYNEERFHQSLGNGTPENVYKTGIGGGAMILEKYGAAVAKPIATAISESGQRRTAACETSTA